MRNFILSLVLIGFVSQGHSCLAQPSTSMPVLRRQATATQLVVDGKPFLVLARELGNSNSSNLKYMTTIWPKLKLMHCNAALIPVYWELTEPEKGRLDFSLVDHLIDSARHHNIKIVFLWFGSWKNNEWRSKPPGPAPAL